MFVYGDVKYGVCLAIKNRSSFLFSSEGSVFLEMRMLCRVSIIVDFLIALPEILNKYFIFSRNSEWLYCSASTDLEFLEVQIILNVNSLKCGCILEDLNS